MASEIELIKKLRIWFPKIGDDTAEFKISPGFTPIATIDSFTEGEHFSPKYFTPYDIGYKSMAGAISDIAASGGAPKYALIAIGLREGNMKFVENLYKGIQEVAKTCNVEVIGGDTIKSKCLSITICVIGETKKTIKRNGAKIGDKICVTGELGSSFAGLLCLQTGSEVAPLAPDKVIKSKVIKSHLNPLPRIKEGIEIAKYANSMIDISDGLSTDLSHILEESNASARIWQNKLPISKETKRIAVQFSLKPEALALNGGEDFELLFTLAEKHIKKLKREVRFTEIGEIIERQKSKGKSQNLIINENGNIIPMGGFDHFNVRRKK